ncbi:UDP-N-acetylglucosamine 1-carboxyvinyltransferase 2 [Clostridia bacterium]|nr:UDP-N-acetylglucosamine 1-carboxyvinyltransferase 2 [Clostridia bacterium]
MSVFFVKGGISLKGSVSVSGAKNAAVAIIPATLVSNTPCTIENIPNIRDVDTLLDIISDMGAKVQKLDEHTIVIDPTQLGCPVVPYEATKKMRASYYLLGALLGRFGKADVAMPGGCKIGVRPIDQHIKGFNAIGVDIKMRNGMIKARSEKLTGGLVYFDTVSVGATINVMLASVRAEGTTVLENAAKEPHVVDVANFLNTLGADILGAGTDIIRVKGVKDLTGRSYSIVPDQIEAGTFMLCAMATRGDVEIKNVTPKHLCTITDKLKNVGAIVTEFDDSVRIQMLGNISNTNIKTMPYPGFPTDMQPQMVALLSLASGTSIVTEGIWESRFKYVGELARLGAKLQVNDRTVVIEGTDQFTAAPVKATDLRAGAALLIAALAAKGTTKIECVHHIERGYEDIVGKLQKLGADIVRSDDSLPSEMAHSETNSFPGYSSVRECS